MSATAPAPDSRFRGNDDPGKAGVALTAGSSNADEPENENDACKNQGNAGDWRYNERSPEDAGRLPRRFEFRVNLHYDMRGDH